MKEFDYIIIGGGCAGLSLAYELEINERLKDKTLAIIEPREEYKKDKTWSFWKVTNHNFDDCVKKSWENFTVNIPKNTNYLQCTSYPYQSIDSGLFYKKINSILKQNLNIEFYKNIDNLKLINCYSNEGNKWKKSKIKFVSDDVLKIFIDEKFIGERGRINCSLRDSSGFWRWLGIQFVIGDK